MQLYIPEVGASREDLNNNNHNPLGIICSKPFQTKDFDDEGSVMVKKGLGVGAEGVGGDVEDGAKLSSSDEVDEDNSLSSTKTLTSFAIDERVGKRVAYRG